MSLTRLIIFSLLVAVAPLRPALADHKPCWFAWWPSHWRDMNWEKRHFEDGKTPITTQWHDEKWSPADWVAQSGGNGMEMIQRFYDAGIVADQYVDDDTPVLEVGPAFFRLGGLDKRRVVASVDHVYHVTGTGKGKPDTIQVVAKSTRKTVGYYTAASGLVLQ